MTTLAETPHVASSDPMAEDTPLFCPFCKECFEGAEVCPDHELTLVPIEQLPPTVDEAQGISETERLSVFDMRFGRGLVGAAGLVLLFAMIAPFVSWTTSGGAMSISGYEASAQRAGVLWALPGVGLLYVAVLYWRRSIREMRSVRLALPLVSLLAAGALGYTLVNVMRGARQTLTRDGDPVTVHLEWGVWALVAGLGLGIVGGFRFGAVRQEEVLPHGARPDEGRSPRIVVDEYDDDDATE